MNVSERAKDEQLEQELLALSSRQEAILAVVSDVIIMEVDNHKLYTWANQAGLAFFGDDVIGREAALYFVDEQTAGAVVQPPINGRQDLIHVRNWQRRRDGEKRLLAWQGLVRKDESGKVTGVLYSARDITERQRIDEKLQQLEERFRAITDSTQDAILMQDPEGRVSFWNPAAERIFGHTRAEAIGQNLHNLIAPERFHPAHHKAFEKYRQTGQGSAVGKILDLEARRKDGHEIVVQLSLSAVHMNDGWHAVGLIRDITERKRQERELREKEHILSESQRLGHIGSFLFDMAGTLQWSEELYRLYGVSPDTFTPTVESFLGLIHPDDRQSMQESMAAGASGEKLGASDFRIIRPDGTMRYVRGWGEAVLDIENRPIYVAGIVQDITERKQAEEKTQQYVAKLAESNKELQDALADIKQLTGMLPICASCKKIRDDKGYWKGVESYITEHSEAVFSHGICPECEKKMYEELEKLKYVTT